MPSITDQEYGQTLLEFLQNKSYPDAENIISADLPSSVLPTVLKLIDQAREDVKKDIRKISQESAPDVDGWIAQAKQIKNDIEDAENVANSIKDQAAENELWQARADDAGAKLRLLHTEIAFSQRLNVTLKKIWDFKQTLEVIRNRVAEGHFTKAADMVIAIEGEFAGAKLKETATVVGLLRAILTDIRLEIAAHLTECWNALFQVDFKHSTVTIVQQIQLSTPVETKNIVEALAKLDLLDEKISSFSKDFDMIILVPRLKLHATHFPSSLSFENDRVRVSGQLSDLTIRHLFSDLNLIINFLHNRLPSSLSISVAGLLIPDMISRLISDWLSPALPAGIDGLQDFDAILTMVVRFTKTLDALGWAGSNVLREWVNEVPQIWLRRQWESSLNNTRSLLGKGLGKVEEVERVETQILSSGDDVFTANEGEDAWNAEWSEEEGEDTEHNTQQSDMPTQSPDEKEEDISAWGLDDDDSNQGSVAISGSKGTGDKGVDNWGWEEETKNGKSPSLPSTDKEVGMTKVSNGHHKASKSPARELTLRETYNITALPKGIFEMIIRIVADAEMLKSEDYKESPIILAAGGLFSLPGLILSMFRAIAPNYYVTNASGNMFLYNDCLWLAERLRQYTGAQFDKPGQINPGAAQTEISALEAFAKRTYSREMESQKTVIGDLLDGAQGFVNCTESPFAQECELAINSIVDRLRHVHKEWSQVLSRSALFQSIGSLLSAMISKIIVDVEDMSDISEPESQKLAEFCSRIAGLEDLFTPQVSPQTSSEQAVPLTAIYTPNWLKFQYLANILESSLVDIKYLWIEGELKLEFEADELVDLLEALFADTEHRRKAVSEIRRPAAGR